MKQVFVHDAVSLNAPFTLDEAAAHHIFDVLRTSEKETIRLVSEEQEVYLAHPLEKPVVYVFGREEVEPRLVNVTLCTALIKGEKFEWMLQKAAELGVSRIVPFVCRNSVVRLEPKKITRKMERWNAILEAACKQSNRPDLVELDPITSIEGLGEYKSKCNLVAWEKEDGLHLADYISKNPDSVTVVIGPEGGFDLSEIERLEELGFAPCTLGNTILRAETAALYVLSCIEYQTHCPCPGESEA